MHMHRWMRIALIVVLVIAGIVVAGAAALWKLGQPPRPKVVPAQPETTKTPVVAPSPVDTTPVLISDAEYAALLERPGVVVPGANMEAAFWFLAPPNPALPAAGFEILRARNLLDTAFRVELLSGRERPRRVGFGDRATIAAQLRRKSRDCRSPINVPFAEAVDRTAWEIGMRPGVAEVILDGLRTISDSTTDAEALRLIDLIPIDSASGSAAAPQMLAGVALRPLASRFTVGNEEFLYVESSRSRKVDTLVDTVRMNFRLVEERMVIGERRLGTTAPFSIAWTRYAAYDEREAQSEAPLMLMRLGPRRVPAIMFRRTEGYAVGGKILWRVATGRCAVVAELFPGC